MTFDPIHVAADLNDLRISLRDDDRRRDMARDAMLRVLARMKSRDGDLMDARRAFADARAWRWRADETHSRRP